MVRRAMVVAFAAALVLLQMPSAGAATANTIHGRVTAQGTKKPIGGICVDVSNEDPHIVNDQRAVTGSEGYYTFTNLRAGAYSVTFTDCQLPIPRYAGLRSATVIFAADGGGSAQRSAVLARAAEIAGTLYDPVSNLPAPGVCVDVVPHTPGMTPAPETDLTGTFHIRGLAPGATKVAFAVTCAHESPYAEQWFHEKWTEAEADPLKLLGGSSWNASETLLGGGLVIKGTVTDEETGLPLVNMSVYAAPTAAFNQRSAGAATDINGDYTLSGLDAGDYKVEFIGSGGLAGVRYATEWWDDQPDYDSAYPVTVSTSVPRRGINAALHRLE